MPIHFLPLLKTKWIAIFKFNGGSEVGLEGLSIEDLLIGETSTIPNRISLKDVPVTPKIV